EVWNKEKITAIMITHDVDESIFLADRVIMMTSGPKAQVGDILEIDFERPRNRKDILEHKDFYDYREHLINFLEHKIYQLAIIIITLQYIDISRFIIIYLSYGNFRN